ncbi:tetratricopeptide repeat protein [Nocardiopsis sp. EMB25]|uniref:ATP-binding protein n=1 Tax=Nocardiopsis sp. EMB25 TaxID=2835867 RepID=UPI00228472E5|nr:tetratricopeptide repeat protein [Nocardiopsis sp. EMB25]MCY9783128.1 tetratricopeptide repeat protein [Nocardiopsis sp. EMB25]
MAEVSGRAVQARDVRGGVHFHGRGADRSPTPVPRQLPGDVRGFVNRTGELDILSTHTRAGAGDSDEGSAAAIHVIAGTAGVGKTALALRWAHRVRNHFPDGQLYVDLQGYGPGLPLSPDQVLDRFLRAFGVSAESIPPDTDSRAALHRSLLADKRVLILLDNASSAAQVRPLLAGSPDCVVVITSRDRLSGLVVRDGAQRLTVRSLDPAEAVELLEHITVRHRPRDDPQEVTELARLCGQLPLALRIAAERAASRPYMPLSDLIQDLRDESALWDALATDDEEEAGTVRSVFAWSYRALPKDAAHLFRLLGLHPGRDFGTGAAAALADLPMRRARRTLDILVGAHLLEQTGPDRYRFHDLIRSYATDQVRDEEEPDRRRQALHRLLTWYLATAHAALPLMDSNLRRPDPDEILPGAARDDLRVFTDHTDAVRWFEVEGRNLTTAIEVAAASGLDGLAWRLPAVLRHFPAFHTLGAEWIASVRLGLEAVRREHRPSAEADLWEGLGIACNQANRPDEAVTHHGCALELRRELGDGLGVVMSLNALGLAHLRGHRLGEARDHLERALEAVGGLGDRLWEGIVLGNLVRCRLELGGPEEATALAERAIGVHRETGNRMSEFACLTSLSAAWRELGRADRSLTFAQQALEIGQDLDQPVREGFALLELGRVHVLLGHMEDALTSFHEAAGLHRRIADHVREAEAFEGVGEVYQELGRPGEAAGFHRQAASAYRRYRDRWRLAVCLDRLADAVAATGDTEAAREHWREAAEVVEDFTDPRAVRLREEVTARFRETAGS